MAFNILILQLRQLGDILLTTPCIRELKRAYPKARVSFLCHPMGRLVLEGNPYLDEILTYDPKGSWGHEWQLFQKLRSAHYDLVLDFMYNPRSALYARATGAQRRLAFPSRRSFLFTEQVSQLSESQYIVTEKFRYLQHIGLQPQSTRPDLPWFEQDAQFVSRWAADFTAFREASLRIIMSPTHRREARQWPLERYARLADRLNAEWGACVIWVWGPGEEEFVRGAQNFCKQPSYLAPASSFRQLAALIAHCDLFIGNSNGPSHVAVAVDTPSLQLHGPTLAKSWCPLTERHQALQAQSKEQGTSTMTAIAEEDAWQAVTGLRGLAEESSLRRGEKVRSSWSELR